MRPRRQKGQDPLLAAAESGGRGVAGVLAEARASLLNPSRPYTPRDSSYGEGARHLLDNSQSTYGDRPTSAFNFNDSSQFNSTQTLGADHGDLNASLQRFDRMRASAETRTFGERDDLSASRAGPPGATKRPQRFSP